MHLGPDSDDVMSPLPVPITRRKSLPRRIASTSSLETSGDSHLATPGEESMTDSRTTFLQVSEFMQRQADSDEWEALLQVAPLDVLRRVSKKRLDSSLSTAFRRESSHSAESAQTAPAPAPTPAPKQTSPGKRPALHEPKATVLSTDTGGLLISSGRITVSVDGQVNFLNK